MILGIYAHPDDEIIFGWGAMQDKTQDRALLNISDNHNTYGAGPWWALTQLCDREGIRLLPSVGLPNEFYRLPTRRASFTLPMAIKKINEAITDAVAKLKPDAVITHNQWGEYGHGDHRLVHDIVLRHPTVPMMWFSDICQTNNCHISTEHVPTRLKRKLGSPVKMHLTLDKKWYSSCKRIYEAHKSWSWGGHEVVTECQLYSL